MQSLQFELLIFHVVVATNVENKRSRVIVANGENISDYVLVMDTLVLVHQGSMQLLMIQTKAKSFPMLTDCSLYTLILFPFCYQFLSA